MKNQPKLYLKLYQLIKFLYASKKNFPKEYKYTIGNDMMVLAWQCLDIFLEANSLPNNEKKSKIMELSVAFDKLKMRLRMGQELRLISEKQFAHIQTNYNSEIGNMIGGWSKWTAEI